jgi:hypothetical protein
MATVASRTVRTEQELAARADTRYGPPVLATALAQTLEGYGPQEVAAFLEFPEELTLELIAAMGSQRILAALP